MIFVDIKIDLKQQKIKVILQIFTELPSSKLQTCNIGIFFYLILVCSPVFI